MLRSTERNGALSFNVRVVPRAARSEVVGEHDGALKVRVAAPPVEAQRTKNSDAPWPARSTCRRAPSRS